MTAFGMDKKLLQRFLDDLDVSHVREDQFTDFFLLPQVDAIYAKQGAELKAMVYEKLSKGRYGPKPPIEMEIPKSARVSTRTISSIGPNYFRPGTVLLPEDRLIYHFIAQEAESVIEESLDRSRVYSNVPLAKKGAGFASSASQWNLLRADFERSIKKQEYSIVLKCDLAQYFSAINQHELVNQLEHQGLAPELVRFTEKFLASLTLDRSSRGIVQGIYGSDVLGNGYLAGVDEFIADSGLEHFRYVDDMYILFRESDTLRSFFPEFVKRLRDYDLAINESKTFATAPAKLLREESELDRAIAVAKEEAEEKLTDYQEIELEVGPYSDTVIDILETPPDEEEVELEATKEVFAKLEDFKGEERDRAEAFCLSFFRKSGDPIAIEYVARRWSRRPERARDYALYLNRFSADVKQSKRIAEMLVASASGMIDYQWAWAALIMRRMPVVSADLLAVSTKLQGNRSQSDVVRSLLTYVVARHGSPPRKKELRDNYSTAPLLVQLATIHSSEYYTSAERRALLKTAEAHGDLQSLMCKALK